MSQVNLRPRQNYDLGGLPAQVAQEMLENGLRFGATTGQAKIGALTLL